MNPTLKKLLIVLGVIVIIAVAALLYQSSSAPADSSSGGLVSSTGQDPTQPPAMATDAAIVAAQNRTDQLVALLSQVSQLTVDTTILTSPAFQSLVDLSIPLPADTNPGRPNPFLPIGSELRVTELSTPSTVTTTPSGSAGTP